MEDGAANEVSLRVIVGIVSIHQDWKAWQIGQVEDVDSIEGVDPVSNTANCNLVLVSFGKEIRRVIIGIGDWCANNT